jgi:hypothetical protein
LLFGLHSISSLTFKLSSTNPTLRLQGLLDHLPSNTKETPKSVIMGKKAVHFGAGNIGEYSFVGGDRYLHVLAIFPASIPR